MKNLDYYRVGRTTLPKGMLLRVAVRLRTEEGYSSTGPGEEVAQPTLWLVRSEVDERQDEDTLFPCKPKQASKDGRFLFELSTERFAAGAFELLIEAGEEEQLQLPEEVWILEEEDYRALTDETSDEEFLPSPGLDGLREVVRYVARLIAERLNRDNFQRDEDFFGPRFRRTLPEGQPYNVFPSSPIHWTTQQVVSAFREVALYGVADVVWTLELTGQRFGLKCSGTLLDPLSRDAAESFSDPENSSLALLERSKDLKGLHLPPIEYDSGRFTLEVSHNIDNFQFVCPRCGTVHRTDPYH